MAGLGPQGTEAHIFKYRIDFESVERALRQQDIAAIAASRPTNPSGFMDRQFSTGSSTVHSRVRIIGH
jgi:hypothetical protein